MRRSILFGVLLTATACADESAPGAVQLEAVAGSLGAPALVAFDRSFSRPVPTRDLVAGGTVRIQFDRQRFYDVLDGTGRPGYFSSQFHCYGYGCCDVQLPEVYVHHRFDGGTFAATPLDAADGADLVIPSGAASLEVYFDVPGFEIRTWYCGCDDACAEANRAQATPAFHDRAAYDSRYGANYRFDVASAPVSAARGVRRLADGQWQSGYEAPSGVRYGWYWDANVWIDVAVENLAFDKVVGVRWTTGGWATHHEALGEYEHALGDGWEQWGVDVTPAARMSSFSWCDPEPVAFEYAIFYRVDGHTYWDNAGGSNHHVELDGTYR